MTSVRSEIVLESGPARAVVRPDAGGRLASLVVDGLELLVGEVSSPFLWGLFPMAPWAGRVRRGVFAFAGSSYSLPVNLGTHAAHGTVFDRPWQAEHDRLEVHLAAGLGPGWPFPGRARQRISLDDGALQLTLEVEPDREPMPACLGWHPWWRRQLARGAPAELDVDAAWVYLRDDEGIPDGRLGAPPPGPWDDCFTGLRGPPMLLWPGALALTLETDSDHVVVFDRLAHAVCIEPQTGPPDALNLGPTRVEPGRPLVARATWRWRPD